MKKILIIGLFLIIGLMAQEKEKEESSSKITGLAYLDYLDVFYHHNPDIEGQHGFYFRRIYLTYDYKYNKQISTRFRLEMNNEGNYISENAMVPFVKDAWINYKFSGQEAVLGISSPPTFAVIEKIWGYRSVEKTPLDLQRMASSRDFGLSVKGSLSNKLLNYHVMFSNGSSNKQEVDKGKSFMLSLGVMPLDELIIEGYGEFSDIEGPYNGYTYQIFAGYVTSKMRIGVQYSDQTIEEESQSDIKRRLFSGFAVGNFSELFSALVRVDRMIDKNPVGEKVAYTPFDPTTPFTLFIAGLEWKALPGISLIPNVEFAKYDELEDGSKPKDDIYGKLTIYWQFK